MLIASHNATGKNSLGKFGKLYNQQAYLKTFTTYNGRNILCIKQILVKITF